MSNASTQSEQLVITDLMSGITYYTWNDFGLVPTEQLIFDFPDINTNYVEVPGTSKSIDLTNCLTPWNTYQNISGSIEFYLIDPKKFTGNITNTSMEWSSQTTIRSLVSRLQAVFNGKKCKCTTYEYLYTKYRYGRFWVSNYGSNDDISTITLSYEVTPYTITETTATGTLPIITYEPGETIDVTSAINTGIRYNIGNVLPSDLTEMQIKCRNNQGRLIDSNFSITYQLIDTDDEYNFGSSITVYPTLDGLHIAHYTVPENIYVFASNTTATGILDSRIRPTWSVTNNYTTSFSCQQADLTLIINKYEL